MSKIQALVYTCVDPRIQKPVQEYLENTLNLYAIDIKTVNGGIKEIFDHSPKQDEIFENIKKSIDEQQVDRIILINHTNCEAYEDTGAFVDKSTEINTHEIHLRHAVSNVKAKFSSVSVEAYLVLLGQANEQTSVQKVI